MSVPASEHELDQALGTCNLQLLRSLREAVANAEGLTLWDRHVYLKGLVAGAERALSQHFAPPARVEFAGEIFNYPTEPTPLIHPNDRLSVGIIPKEGVIRAILMGLQINSQISGNFIEKAVARYHQGINENTLKQYTGSYISHMIVKGYMISTKRGTYELPKEVKE